MNKLFSFFKAKRLRTLRDVDNLTMAEIDKLLETRLPNIDKINEQQTLKSCQKCDGQLEKFMPETRLDEMMLFECVNCHERCYKLP